MAEPLETLGFKAVMVALPVVVAAAEATSMTVAAVEPVVAAAPVDLVEQVAAQEAARSPSIQ